MLCSVGEEVFGTAESDVDIGADVMRIHLLLDAAGHQLMMHVVIDAGEDDGERSGRSAYLHFAAAEHGDDQAGDDGGHQTFGRTHTR